MTISRVSTLSLGIVFAVFALGYASPAFAARPVCPGDHPSCKDDSGSGDGDTVFMVEMQSGTVVGADGLVTSNGACGTTEGARNDNVRFPDGCVPGVEVFFTTGPTGGPLTLTAFALVLRFNKSDMLIFFTDGQVQGNMNTGDVYVSERLPVTISRNGSITVEVNETNLEVEKNHQLRKGDLVGPIAIGEIVFTPIE